MSRQLKRGPKNKKNFLMAYIPLSDALGIDIEWKKPTLRNSAARKAWMKKALVKAKLIKLDLESGRLGAADMPGRVIEKPGLISDVAANRYKKELQKREKILIVEREFIDLFYKLEQSLTSWDAHTCNWILYKIESLKLTKMILLRNSEWVYKLRMLQVLDGDVEEPNNDYLVIRQRATEVYDGFKKIFSKDPDPEDRFWIDFCEQVETFKTLTKDMHWTFRTSLNEEGYKRLLDTKGSTSAVSNVS